MIAFLGMGLLGSNFVRALRRRGEEVQVWNRTASKARALEPIGVRVHEDAAAAVRGASRVHLTLGDDASVDDVLARVVPALEPDAVVVDHTTTTASGTRERAARLHERGITFVHAPVFMGPQQALESSGLMLVSGDPAHVAAARPHLAPMTGKLIELGPEVETAASFKLLGNLFLMFLTTGLADMLSLGKALGIAPADAVTLFEHFNPGATIGARAKRMLEAKFTEPSWELGMARKDARLMLEEAARAGVPLAVLPAIAARMDQVIAEGHASDDWTVLGKDALR